MLPVYRNGTGAPRAPSKWIRYLHWRAQVEKRVGSNPSLRFLRPLLHFLTPILACFVLLSLIVVASLFVSTLTSLGGDNDTAESVDVASSGNAELNVGEKQDPNGIGEDGFRNKVDTNKEVNGQRGSLPRGIPNDLKRDLNSKFGGRDSNSRKIGRNSDDSAEQLNQDQSNDSQIDIEDDSAANSDGSESASFDDVRQDDLAQVSDTRERAERVRRAFKHAWKGYKTTAFGHDEIRPASNQVGDSWQGFGATLVDSLDTMMLMGLTDELAEARRFVEQIDFYRDVPASFFEFTIRYVGGLLGAHALSDDELYLRKATEIADRLMHAFPTDGSSPFPRHTVNLKTTEASFAGWNSGNAILSEIGSCQLEFAYLSHHTGNETYYKAARKVMSIVHQIPQDTKGLYPVSVRADGKGFGNKHITLGGLADSFYEYLIKLWVLTDRQDNEMLEMYTESAGAVLANLKMKVNDFGKRDKEFTFLGELKNGRPNYQMEHLQCFASGMFALGSMEARRLAVPITEAQKDLVQNQDEHLQFAEDFGESCAGLYRHMDTGLAPERIQFTPTAELEQRGWWSVETQYQLRPETVESLFVLYRATGNNYYRELGWIIFQAIEEQCWTPYAYTGLLDVTKSDKRGNEDDSMQSFFLAETLKYLYLLFHESDEDASLGPLLPLDEFVFTTEAHPLRVLR